MDRIARLVLTSVLLLLLGCLTGAWSITLDFEEGSDWAAVQWVSPGIKLMTVSGDDLLYASIDGGWPFASDNGKQQPDWEFCISGDVAVVSPYDNAAVMEFVDPVSMFSVGYSSWFPFVAEAYSANGTLLDRAVGAANSRYWNGGSLSYLCFTRSVTDIYSVRLAADQGGFPEAGWWVIDNVTLDRCEVPECSGFAFLALALPMVLRSVRRRRG